MKLMQQSRQVNLYLTKANIEKIQNYLVERNFVFIKDEALLAPQTVYTHDFAETFGRSRYILFPENQITFRSWEQNGMVNFRLQEADSTVVELNFLGKKDDIFRIRFYYCPYYFENHEKKYKNPEFGVHVDRFFRWLRRQYKRVPDMPTFYYNPDFIPKEWF